MVKFLQKNRRRKDCPPPSRKVFTVGSGPCVQRHETAQAGNFKGSVKNRFDRSLVTVSAEVDLVPAKRRSLQNITPVWRGAPSFGDFLKDFPDVLGRTIGNRTIDWPRVGPVPQNRSSQDPSPRIDSARRTADEAAIEKITACVGKIKLPASSGQIVWSVGFFRTCLPP